jgi:hypothetical protein
MDTQSLPLVPFGKYKGKPITELLADTQTLNYYKDAGILQKYPIVYNICVNQTITTNNQSSKTPEHNKLQILFSDNKINTIKLLRRVIFNKNSPIPNKCRYDFRVTCEGIFNWDIIVKDISIYKCVCDATYMECECDGSHYKYYNDICIEIKPLLGEDYPAVKRKMDTQISLTKNEYYDKDAKIGDKSKYIPTFVLLIKEFNATSATKEQLIKYFDSSNIKVVFIDDLLDILPSQTTIEHLKEKNEIITFQPIKQKELEDENKLLNEKLIQAEEKIRQLEQEIHSLKSQKQSNSIKDYFGKK